MQKIFSIWLCAFSFLAFVGCAPKPTANANTGMAVNDPPASLRVSEPGRDAAEPSLAADAQGNIYTLYVEHTEDKSADLYLRKFAGALAAAYPPVRINPNPGEVKAWRGDPPTISIGADSKIYVGWNRTVKTDDDSPANDLMLSVSSDGGATFAAPVRVNDDVVPASHGMHAMTVTGNTVYFAWLDERYLKKEHPQPVSKGGEMHHGEAEPNAELYFADSKDGGKSFSPNKKIGQDICPCCKAQMTSMSGRLFISWRQVLPGEFRHVAVISTGDGGETFAEQVIVNDDRWHIMACPVSGAPLATGKDGALATAWYTAGEAGSQGLYWAESKDSGKTFSPRALVSDGVIFGTSILLPDKSSGYRVIWTANGKITTAKLSGSGQPTDVRELGAGELPAAAAAGDATYIAFVKNENGKKSVWVQRIPV